MGAIDIGVVAEDRISTWSADKTLITKNNPANADGTIDTFKVWAEADMTGFRAGTFDFVSGTSYKCRDSEAIGNVTSGSEQTFTGLTCDVVTGDYAGCYFATGTIEKDSFGYAGVWYTNGEYIDPNDQTSYDLSDNDALSLYGTGQTPVVAPTVTTQAVTNIEATTATGNGNITDTGGENCLKRGVCWNTSGNPTIADSKSEETDSFGTGAFTRAMTGLTPGQHYYVKAYAYNSAGYGYGSQVEFTTHFTKTSSDTGSGADAKASGNPLATYSRSEAGSGAEAKATNNPLATLLKAETGSGLDTILSLLGKIASETGIGVESSYRVSGIKTSSDVGSGADAKKVDNPLATLVKADSGIGSDALLALLDRVFTEYGYGVDTSKFGDRPLLVADSGLGVESSLLRELGEPKYSSDVGAGIDASILASLLTRADSGVATEAITLLAAMLAGDNGQGVDALVEVTATVKDITTSDAGQGVDKVLSYLRQLVDSGEGEENLHLVGYVGRRMRMIVYQREAFQMKVYTSEIGH